MTIRIETDSLIKLINDLKHTADTDPENGAVNGILLHTDRGYIGGDPGKTDLLVGTSTNRFAVGHTYGTCYGQMSTPMLWPLASALTVVQIFKPATKDNKDHMVQIRAGDGAIHVEELQPDLFGGATKFEFAAGDASKYPRGLWRVLDWSEPWTPGSASDRISQAPEPRTDVSVLGLAPFLAVAKNHGGTIEMYRYHQDRPVLITIGDRFRGTFHPRDWDSKRNPQAGRTPYGEVFTPELPPEVDKTVTPAPGNLLEQAADVALTLQLASTSTLARKLRVSAAKAGLLLGELEVLGVVGPASGSRAREVLVQPAQLGTVLAKIRARTPAVVPEDEPVLDDMGALTVEINARAAAGLPSVTEVEAAPAE